MKKKKPDIINADYLGSVRHLWLAKPKVDVDDIMYEVWNSWKSIPAKYRTSSKSTEKEIVYYPIYKYATTTSIYWTTTSTRTSGVYAGSTKVGTSTTRTTTGHERHNVRKMSDIYVKKNNNLLEITKADDGNLVEIDKSTVNVPAYAPGLLFTKQENKENGIDASRKGVAKSASVSTVYTTHMLLVPIFRQRITYKKKTYYFEINQHNGAFVAHLPQKPLYAIYKYYTFICYNILRLACLAVPCSLIYNNWKDTGFSDQVGWISKIFYSLLLLACAVFGLIFCIGTHVPLVKFEKYTCSFNPKVTLSKYRWSELGYLIGIFVIISLITIFACGKLFGA